MAGNWFEQNLDYAVFTAAVLAVSGGLAWWLKRRVAPAKFGGLFWGLLAAGLVAGWFSVDAAGRKPQLRVMSFLGGIAPTYASELERMGHARLKVEDAANEPRYLEMIEALIRWQKLNPLVSDIYTFRRAADGGWVFLLDAETDYDGDGLYSGEREERTEPGEVYPEGGDELEEAYAGRANFMSEAVTDRWGRWVSMQVPMRDANGRVEAVLGVDYSAELWDQEIAARRLVALLYLALAAAGLAGGGVMVATNRAELAARTEAEKRLRTADARLRAMLDHLPFSLWLMDADGRCRAFNSLAAATRGLAEGKQLAELDFGVEERAALEADCRRAQGGAVVSREVRRERENGWRHYFQLFAPVAEGPHRTGLVAVELDITERVDAVRARRESDDRLARHVQQTPLAYIEWGMEREVLSWNPGAERIFGHSAAEALGRNLEDLVVPASAAKAVHEICGRLLRKEGGGFSTNENITRDGKVIVCEWHNTPLVDDTGRVIAVASHAQDITERVALEERLRQAQRMESIGQLAGGVAHEFNNLLTPMLMQVGHLQAVYAEDERLLGMLRPVEDSILQAAELNQRILAVGRKHPEGPNILPLNPLVEASVELLRHTMDRRIEFVVRLGEGLPDGEIARGAITQIVMNLALNARDALLAKVEHGGAADWTPRLTITTSQTATVPAKAPEKLRRARTCLTLNVTDNGEGMSPAVRSKAFEPFFTTKPAGHGTGLGLAVVWNVVENLGGAIDLNTAPGEGTSFTIFLPVAHGTGEEGTPARVRAADSLVSKRKSLRILVVEDNELVRSTFCEVLRAASHIVTWAEDGEAGLAKLEAGGPGHYDVALVDLNMPRLSGQGLLERIRGRGLVHGLLVASGVVDPALEEKLVALGVRRVLRKPVGMHELLAAVTEAGNS